MSVSSSRPVRKIVSAIEFKNYAKALDLLSENQNEFGADHAFKFLETIVKQCMKNIDKVASANWYLPSSEEEDDSPQEDECIAVEDIIKTCCLILQSKTMSGPTNESGILALIRLITFTLISKENIEGRILVTETLLKCLRNIKVTNLDDTITEQNELINWHVHIHSVFFIWEVTNKKGINSVGDHSKLRKDLQDYRGLSFLLLVHAGPSSWPELIDKLNAVVMTDQRSKPSLELAEKVFDEIHDYVVIQELGDHTILSCLFQLWMMALWQSSGPRQQRKRNDDLSELSKSVEGGQEVVERLMAAVFVVVFGISIEGFHPSFLCNELPQELKTALPVFASISLDILLNSSENLSTVQLNTISIVLSLLTKELNNANFIQERLRGSLLDLTIKFLDRALRDRTYNSETLITGFRLAHNLFFPLLTRKVEQLTKKQRKDLDRLAPYMEKFAYETAVVLWQQKDLDSTMFCLQKFLLYVVGSPPQNRSITLTEAVAHFQKAYEAVYRSRKNQKDWQSVMNDFLMFIPLCYRTDGGGTTSHCKNRPVQQCLVHFLRQFHRDVPPSQQRILTHFTMEEVMKELDLVLDDTELATWTN